MMMRCWAPQPYGRANVRLAMGEFLSWATRVALAHGTRQGVAAVDEGTMPRKRYCQAPLPLESQTPDVELFGPDQPNAPVLQVAEQGQLGVVPLGPLLQEWASER